MKETKVQTEYILSCPWSAKQVSTDRLGPLIRNLDQSHKVHILFTFQSFKCFSFQFVLISQGATKYMDGLHFGSNCTSSLYWI